VLYEVRPGDGVLGRSVYWSAWAPTVAPSTRRAFTLALYLLWVLATYLLEGRILTLQRPEATSARLVYALVTDILIGIGGSVLAVRFLSNSGAISARQAGFGGLRHAAVAGSRSRWRRCWCVGPW
jgi:hypothetical protein